MLTENGPIYSEKHDGAKSLNKEFWAEIEDKDQAAGHTKSKKEPWLMGSKSAKWLYSKAVHGQEQTTWGRMKRGCVIDVARATSFQWNIKAKHVSDIFPEWDIKVVRDWHRDAMTRGKADTATIVLTEAEKDVLKAEKEKLKAEKAALKANKTA